MITPMNEQRANAIYNVLVYAGAPEEERFSFVVEMTSERPTSEWRFCGHLGFGGKYRPETNTVDCYPEDENRMRRNIIHTANIMLMNHTTIHAPPAQKR